MNRIERVLKNNNPGLFAKFEETVAEVILLLGKYSANFPTYTDHSSEHVREVFKLAADLLTPDELENLNEDELYVLACACFLHDVGMCIPEDKIQELVNSENFRNYKSSYPENSMEDFIRNIHHELSYHFILKEWELLKLQSAKYAEAIALVAQGHRKVELSNTEMYKPKFFVRDGRDFVCLPYLAAILRIADELDVTNVRTPRLLTKYYMPNNEQSQREWRKHIATTQVNFTEDKVLYEVTCTDQNIYAALQEQFEKIQSVLNYCQKTIRGIANTEKRSFSLTIREICPNYKFKGFDPKGIRYSFNVQNVITAFIGDDLYDDKLVAIREAVQNSIDSCRYRKSQTLNDYRPVIKIFFDEEKIIVDDNGSGMDEFIIENFFGRLGSSFYEQEKVKDTFEAIGQFGVGVFSYFLLGEYVDIETKTDRSDVLKFRIDRDPHNYFHFFDETLRTTTGTTTTIFLKQEYVGKISSSDIGTYVNDVFRFIEFPIELCYDESTSLIESKPLKLDFKQDIASKFSLLIQERQSTFEIIEIELNTANYEGYCALIVSKGDNPFQGVSGLFDTQGIKLIQRRYSNDSFINICQKGIFVAAYDTVNLGYTVGNINIKKKVKINLDRNSFSDVQAIRAIVVDFEVELLEKVSEKYFKGAAREQKVILTENFIGNYFNFLEVGIMPRYMKVFEQLFYYRVLFDGLNHFYSIGEIINSFDSIAMVPTFSVDSVLTAIKEPIVFTLANYYSLSWNATFEMFKVYYQFSPFIFCDDNKRCFVIFNKSIEISPKELESEILDYHYVIRNCIPSNGNYIVLELFKANLVHSRQFLNRSHPFVNTFFDALANNSIDSFNKKVYDSIFEYLHKLFYGSGDRISIRDLMYLVNKLKPELRYNFTGDDFMVSLSD